MSTAYGSGVRCAHETARGYGCLNPAKDGPFCPGHNPRNQCGRPTRNGTACKRRAAVDGSPCTKHR